VSVSFCLFLTRLLNKFWMNVLVIFQRVRLIGSAFRSRIFFTFFSIVRSELQSIQHASDGDCPCAKNEVMLLP